jgi:hypothetical protein
MTQACNGCKAIIARTDDDYNVYSLQRQLFPVDPLVIIPQPGSYVSLVCDDGFVVKVLYHQGDDWPTVWNTIKAECENHKPFATPYTPTVDTKPGTDTDTIIPPEDPKTPNPTPDPMPGPGTEVAPDVPTPSPTPEPAPAPAFSWPPGLPPNFNPTPEGEEGTPTVNPYEPEPLDPNYHWLGWDISAAYSCLIGQLPSEMDPACEQFAVDYLWNYVRSAYAALPDPKSFRWYQTPIWVQITGQGPGTRHNIAADCSAGFVTYDGSHDALNDGNYWQINLKAVAYVGTPI